MQDRIRGQAAHEHERRRALVDADLDRRPAAGGKLREQPRLVLGVHQPRRDQPAADGQRAQPHVLPDRVRGEAAKGLRQRHGRAVNLAGLSGRVDVALLSLGTTLGLRRADDALAELLAAAARLVIGGADRAAGLAWLDRCGVPEPPGVEWAGTLPRDRWLERVARARVFVNASRREDHGLAQLEALAAGTPLVTVPSPGAYEALPIARRLAPGLVAADVSAPALATALRAGLALEDRRAYAERATAELAPYRREAVLAVVRDEVAPALGLA